MLLDILLTKFGSQGVSVRVNWPSVDSGWPYGDLWPQQPISFIWMTFDLNEATLKMTIAIGNQFMKYHMVIIVRCYTASHLKLHNRRYSNIFILYHAVGYSRTRSYHNHMITMFYTTYNGCLWTTVFYYTIKFPASCGTTEYIKGQTTWTDRNVF